MHVSKKQSEKLYLDLRNFVQFIWKTWIEFMCFKKIKNHMIKEIRWIITFSYLSLKVWMCWQTNKFLKVSLWNDYNQYWFSLTRERQFIYVETIYILFQHIWTLDFPWNNF